MTFAHERKPFYKIEYNLHGNNTNDSSELVLFIL